MSRSVWQRLHRMAWAPHAHSTHQHTASWQGRQGSPRWPICPWGLLGPHLCDHEDKQKRWQHLHVDGDRLLRPCRPSRGASVNGGSFSAYLPVYTATFCLLSRSPAFEKRQCSSLLCPFSQALRLPGPLPGSSGRRPVALAALVPEKPPDRSARVLGFSSPFGR